MLTVWHNIKLSVYPLLGGFSATRAASLRLAALTDNLSMRAVWSAAVVVFGPHQVTATREHAFNASDLPEAKSLSMFPQYLFPSVVLFEQEFCGSRNKLFWRMSATFAMGILNQGNT